MNIALFMFEEIGWDLHLATELEIIEDHLHQGDPIRLYVCDADLPTCRTNINHAHINCVRCKARRSGAIGTLPKQVPVVSFVRLKPEERVCLLAVPRRFESIDQLRGYYFESFEAGMSVIASLFDITHQEVPDLVEHADLIYNTLVGGIIAYISAKNILRDDAPDRIYIMNGRWSWARGVFRACQETGIDCWIHERGSTEDKYAVFKNHLPQDIAKTSELMRIAWANAEPEVREKSASEYFNRRAAGVGCNWFSFVTNQRVGSLPENWAPDRVNICLFTSSFFEFHGIDRSQQWSLYPHQRIGIEAISQAIEGLGDKYHLYIRIHPNQASNLNEIASLLSICRHNTTVFHPNSSVSTYALIAKASLVITFGSTVGVEATYWRRPSLLLATSGYSELDVSYIPKTHTELIEMITSDLEPKQLESAMKYGYYMNTFGIHFKKYTPETPFTGMYLGRRFEEFISWTAWAHLHILSIPLWSRKLARLPRKIIALLVPPRMLRQLRDFFGL